MPASRAEALPRLLGYLLQLLQYGGITLARFYHLRITAAKAFVCITQLL